MACMLVAGPIAFCVYGADVCQSGSRKGNSQHEIFNNKKAQTKSAIKPGARPAKPKGAEISLVTDIACKVLLSGKMIATIQPEKEETIQLQKGTYDITFVSIENNEDRYTLEYVVEDNGICDFVEIKLIPIRNIRIEVENTKDIDIVKFEDKGKFGFKIRKKDIVVIPAQFDAVERFWESLAPVELDGKWGFVDRKGNIVIPCNYDYALVFNEGLAPVRSTDNRWGYIDKLGTVVIPFIYDEALWFGEGLAPVRTNGKYGFINTNGDFVIPCQYDGAWKFSEGLAAVQKNGKWGFIDRENKIRIPFKFDYSGEFSYGTAYIKYNGNYGEIDKQGNFTPSK